MEMINIKPKELTDFAIMEIIIKYLTKYKVLYLKKDLTVSTDSYQLFIQPAVTEYTLCASTVKYGVLTT